MTNSPYKYLIKISNLELSGQLFRVAREFAMVNGIKSIHYAYQDMFIGFLNRQDRDKIYFELIKYTRKI